MTTNQTLWLDTDGLHVGGTQLITTGGGVGMGTSSIYGALTVAGTPTQAAAVFWGNVGIGTAAVGIGNAVSIYGGNLFIAGTIYTGASVKFSDGSKQYSAAPNYAFVYFVGQL